MAKIKLCKEKGCKDASTSDGYCRLHYLKYWKTIREKKKKQAVKKLNQYIEYICKNNPDRPVDAVKRDIRSEDFEKRIDDLFGEKPTGSDAVLSDPSFEEDVQDLLKQIKFEKEF